MKKIETKFVDRSQWPPGIWDGEPDKVQWTTASGLVGLIRRNPYQGYWCGYVGVSPDHSLYEVDYYIIRSNVHGGLTFNGFCSDEENGICHIVEPGEPDNVWWLGFDCNHSEDASPMNKFGVYRSQEYVMLNVEKLAEQLSNVR